jgi:hypothetical protein
MSALTVQGTKWATRPGLQTSFAAQNGTPPYSFSVAPNGAGGTINASSGLYTAPSTIPFDSRCFFDTIIASDSASNTAQTWISVGDFWQLVAEIFRNQLNLNPQRISLFNQKWDMPKDNDPFIVIYLQNGKPISSGRTPAGTPGPNGKPGADQSLQWIENNYLVDVHLCGRGYQVTSLVRQFQMAATSIYSEQVQEANSFYLSPLGSGITDMSGKDGTAYLYEFVLSYQAYYTDQMVSPAPYFNQFGPLEIVPQA